MNVHKKCEGDAGGASPPRPAGAGGKRVAEPWKVERFIQTPLREWAYAAAYATSAVRTCALGNYLRFYNAERRHTALGFQPPLARLAALSEQRPY